jgi:glyoxylase-like metal-dependent hydrolase (beta-lactamase superfamily II)
MARSAPAVALAPELWRIPVATSDGINAFAVLADDGSVTLIDAGMPWAWKRLEAGLRHLGSHPSQVSRILVTHAHADHVGNVARVRTESGADVHAPEDDEPYLRAGESPPIGPHIRRFRGTLQRWGRYPAIEVGATFADGALIDAGGGIRAHHTPGHTPGHTSFVHEPTGVLITGDVVHFWRARIRIGIKAYCNDVALNERSAQTLGALAGDTIAFTHGPHLASDGRRAMHAFLASRPIAGAA